MATKSHAWVTMKHRAHFHWLFCARCGLVALKNTASRKAAAAPCPGAEKED